MSRNLHVELSDTHAILLDRLMSLCDLNKKEVVENALMLLGWATSEAAKGLSIASVDEKRKVYKEIQTPALQSARLRAERMAEAAERQAAATAG
jgi:hypothetical protein